MQFLLAIDNQFYVVDYTTSKTQIGNAQTFITKCMKNNFNIFFLALALVVMQGCTSKREEKASTEAPLINPLPTLAEKRAKLESQRAEREEKRLADLEARVKSGLYYTDKSGKPVYHKAEVDPTFIGGDKALREYLRDHLKYPDQAQKDELEGTVFVDFVVLADGRVNEVEVINEPGNNIDQSFINEAVRVVGEMPRWKPGLQHGKAVDVKFSLPVTFQILSSFGTTTSLGNFPVLKKSIVCLGDKRYPFMIFRL